jgi:hypothetical protein
MRVPAATQPAIHTAPSSTTKVKSISTSPAVVSQPPASPQFYYMENGQRFGPVSLQRMQERVAMQELRPEDHVWRQGMLSWAAAREVSELFPNATTSIHSTHAPDGNRSDDGPWDWIAARARNFVEYARRNQWDQKCRRVVSAVICQLTCWGKSVSNWVAAQTAPEPTQHSPLAAVSASGQAGSIPTAQLVANQLPTGFPVVSGSIGLSHSQKCWYCRMSIPSGCIQCPFCRAVATVQRS